MCHFILPKDKFFSQELKFSYIEYVACLFINIQIKILNMKILNYYLSVTTKYIKGYILIISVWYHWRHVSNTAPIAR